MNINLSKYIYLFFHVSLLTIQMHLYGTTPHINTAQGEIYAYLSLWDGEA